MAARAFKAAFGTDIGLLVIGAIAEHQLLIGCGLIFLAGLDIALIEHFLENGKLTLAVVLLADIGIIERGVIGDANQRGAFGSRQLGNILAEIHARRALHAEAALAEIDRVEIPFHDLVLGIELLRRQRGEDLLHLAVDGHVVLMRQVLDKLLSDGGCAVGRVAAGKVCNGRERSHPVHAVVLGEALILDGDGCMHQIERNLVI